ncbi:MAG: tetratricopeptide repeat protein, partial [Ktedonobacteraceae bacterium]|nr:tetratricopeptide repeat protein [Ktedonobacteraceae bacterium]
EVHLARLAIHRGDFKDAASHLALANEPITRNLHAAQIALQSTFIQGQLYLAQGDFALAEKYYSDAHNRANALQEPLLAAEALLGMAQAHLAREDLDAAFETFLAAGRAFQEVESTNGDGSAVLGVAQVHMGQQQWDEALENCEASLTRFSQANDSLGQADALLTRGLAHRSRDENDEALADFEQALKLYQQQRRPLGVADTRYARAGIFFQQSDLEHARDEQTKAITQVENVMNSISTPQQWSLFLRQYADLYAQTIVTDIRRNADEQARTLAQNFARIAGPKELLQNLQTYERDLPTDGEDLSPEDARANQDLLTRIRQVIKVL